MDLQVSIGAALFAGLISFLSPCVFPLVPPYLCFITGATLEELQSRSHLSAAEQRRAMLAALMFVLGFATIFIALGIGVSVAGYALRAQLPLLSKIAGFFIILMGVHFLGLFKIPFLNREARYHHEASPASLLGAYAVGLAFASGWTPCLGPVLATISTIAASQQDAGRGAMLLAVYSMGLGIPFLLSAYAMGYFLKFMGRFRKYLGLVEKLMGVLLIITGLMFMTNSLQLVSSWMMEAFPWLAEIG